MLIEANSLVGKRVLLRLDNTRTALECLVLEVSPLGEWVKIHAVNGDKQYLWKSIHDINLIEELPPEAKSVNSASCYTDCPKCGGQPTVISVFDGNAYYAECSKCSWYGSIRDVEVTPHSALEWWHSKAQQELIRTKIPNPGDYRKASDT